jgi:hypothetical protein
MTRLRLWTLGDSPDRERLPADVVVAEWTGRLGHPTSYALLGVAPQPTGVTFTASSEGRQFEDSAAERFDVVAFGLPESYRAAVEDELGKDVSSGWNVVLGAHGQFGSSPMAFRRIASFLSGVAGLDCSKVSDAEIWKAWDGAGAAQRRS